MELNYKIIEITTEAALKDALFTLSGKDKYFLYRGQSNNNWSLQTSLERKLENLNKTEMDIGKYEKLVVEECQNKDSNSFPIEIISKIQHYGGATRLIDFTHQFPVAVFFAFCDFPSQNVSIWAISRRDIPYISYKQLEYNKGDLDLFEIDFQRRDQEEKVWDFYIDEFVFSSFTNIRDFINSKMEDYPEELKKFKIGSLDLLASKEDEFNWQYQMEHGIESWVVRLNELSPRDKFVQESLKHYCKDMDNERLYNQSGLFLFAPNNNYSFEKNLFLGKAWKELESNIIKIKNPDFSKLDGICSDVYNSFRGVIKFNISHSLTKFILRILKEGKYEILLPDFWTGGTERKNKEIENVNWDGSSISFLTLFPDKIGFHKDLTHKLIE